MPPLFDAHNHLQDAWLAPHRDRVFADLAIVGVRAAVVNGTSEADWADVAALCLSSSSAAQASDRTAILRLIPSYGVHPWDVGNRTPAWQEILESHLDADPRAIIGEIGLDRWILDRARPDDPRLSGLRRAPVDEQVHVFRSQLALAAERNIPVSIHCLEAFGLLYDTLRTTSLPDRGFLLHAYSGPVEMVSAFARLGAYFSFNGSFLEPRKARLRAVYSAIPVDRLLVETDAPAMRLPVGLARYSLPPAADGQAINHPANIASTYEGLADWRGLTIDALATSVAENFARLFGVSS